MKEHSTKRKRWIIGLVLVLLLILWAVRWDVKVVRYSIENEKLTSEVKLCFISDLHSEEKDILGIIEKEKVDYVLLGGDIFDDVREEEGAIKLLQGLKGYRVFYVSGNHEYWSGRMDHFKEVLRDYGVTILSNEKIDLGGIVLTGYEDPEAGLPPFKGTVDKNRFELLLSHRPERFDEYVASGYDLILSGHAHGGQWIFPFINGVYAPDQGFFPKLAGGMVKKGPVTMITGRGLATQSTRVPRLFNRPELLFITLKP
ncbi:metallophosphoesterase [Guggenheimella bovis]